MAKFKNQQDYIMETAAARGLNNVVVVEGDMTIVDFGAYQFDRVLSCETFERLKHYDAMMEKVAGVLKVGGKFMAQMFCHHDNPYHFDEANWTSSHFSTGGFVPSSDLLQYFDRDDLEFAGHWFLHGRHYKRTLEAWLENLVEHQRAASSALIGMHQDRKLAKAWYHRWAVYFATCIEMFSAEGGGHHGVTVFLFEKVMPGEEPVRPVEREMLVMSDAVPISVPDHDDIGTRIDGHRMLPEINGRRMVPEINAHGAVPQVNGHRRALPRMNGRAQYR